MASLLIAVCLILSMTAPIPAHAEGTKTVRVGYYENEIFQEGAQEGAVKSGFAYEYYRKLAEYTGWKYEYVYGSFSDLYQMLLDGEIDLLAGLALKEDRIGLIGYPDAAMGHESYNLVKHENDTEISVDPITLDGKRIGVMESALVDALRQSHLLIGGNPGNASNLLQVTLQSTCLTVGDLLGNLNLSHVCSSCFWC